MIIEQRHMHNYPNEIDIDNLKEFYINPEKAIFKNIDKFNLDEGEEIYFIKNAKRIYFQECDINNTLYIEDATDSITIKNSSMVAPLYIMRNSSSGCITIENSILKSLYIYDSCKLNSIVLSNSKIEKLHIISSIINRGIKIINGIKDKNGLHIFEDSKSSKIDEIILNSSFINQSTLSLYNNVSLPDSMSKISHYYEGSLKDITLLKMVDSFIAYDIDLINYRDNI